LARKKEKWLIQEKIGRQEGKFEKSGIEHPPILTKKMNQIVLYLNPVFFLYFTPSEEFLFLFMKFLINASGCYT